MKNTFIKTRNCLLLAGLLFCAAGLVTASASSSLVTFSVDMSTNVANGTFVPSTMTVEVRGTFNGWANSGGPFNNGGVQLQEVGLSAPYIYTNTVNDTVNPNGGTETYVFLTTSNAYDRYESLNSGYNRNAQLPGTSGASLVLPTPYFGDLGGTIVSNVTFNVDMAEQAYLGNFHPASGDQVVVQGIFNGWTGDTWLLTNSSQTVTEPGGIVTNQVWANTFPITNSPAGIEEFKYIINSGGNNNYENVGVTNKDPNSNNRYFATVAQTLPLVYFGDQPFSLTQVSNLIFSVDMSIVSITDTNFDPTTVTINGDFCGWGGVSCTNNSSAANTNIYTVVAPTAGGYTEGLGSTLNYQYRYMGKDGTGPYYDHANGVNGGQNNRAYLVGNTNPNGTNVASVWNDASLDDYILTPTSVYFSVNMQSNGVYVSDVNGHQFNPSADDVYINGTFAGWYAWEGANPVPAPAGYQMIQSNSSSIYTNTVSIPPGPAEIIYKYGLDIGRANGGPSDDEAGFALNHIRVERTLAFQPYLLPIDTFGYQYNEPYFSANSTVGGNLTVGLVSGGRVPVTWLGRPGAHLQTKSSLTSGSWQSIPATDGTNWSTGFGSTNGFVSETNYPTSGGTIFFRLVKP